MTQQEYDLYARQVDEFGTYYDNWWKRLFADHLHLFVVGEVINFPADMMQELEDKWKPLHDISKFLLIYHGGNYGMPEPILLLKELFADERINEPWGVSLDMKMKRLEKILEGSFPEWKKEEKNTQLSAKGEIFSQDEISELQPLLKRLKDS